MSNIKFRTKQEIDDEKLKKLEDYSSNQKVHYFEYFLFPFHPPLSSSNYTDNNPLSQKYYYSINENGELSEKILEVKN